MTIPPSADSQSSDQRNRILDERYSVEREIGRGGMAVVYLARDLRHDRPVALKVFSPFYGGGAGTERFHREISVMARLRHPHILPLHDSGETSGCLYYVMPYVDGESLRARLAREPQLPLEEALRIAREVADALTHAHRLGIIHRDIKPENILLADGHATVADFGIAHIVAAAHTGMTEAGSAVGTPLYMSPEQASGDDEIDGRSDIYSLGCVLFEMLAGHPPFSATSAQELIALRFTTPPPSLAALRPGIPPALDELVLRSLAPDPGQRLTTAADLARELARLEAALAGADASSLLVSNLASGTPAITCRLPQALGPLIGRDRERAEALALLRRSDVRLLTLTGPGGSGKTRLALQLAADLRDRFPDGVALVELASTLEPSLLGSRIAHALGVREQEKRSPLEAVRLRIGSSRVLLVLDNFEHLVDAAPEISELLAGCPSLVVLVTSRVRLRIRGEHEFEVPPLALANAAALSDSDELRETPAIQLFLTRAAEVRPGRTFTHAELRCIADICARLDGLPLAIELAAARSSMLQPAAMLARLDRRLDLLTSGRRDAPERHRTLHSAIAWSHELLEPRERLLFRRLAAFAGSAPLPAIAPICLDDPHAEMDALELAESLLGKSLVRRADDEDEPRLIMLETIREFAAERLDESGEGAAVRARHAAWYSQLAESAAGTADGVAQSHRIAELDREQANLHAALTWAEGEKAADMAARLTRALWRRWLISGRLTEGRERIERVLGIEGVPSAIRAELLNAVGVLAQNQGDYSTAYARVEDSLALWRQLDDRAGLAESLTSIGWLAFRRGRYADARRQSEESLALHRQLGQQEGEARALTNLGFAAMFTGGYQEARAMFSESLDLRRQLGDLRGIGFGLTTLGWVIGREGERARAETLLDEAISLYEQVGERQLLAWTISIVVEIMGDAADVGAADIVQERTIPVFRDIGDRWGLGYAFGVVGMALRHRGDLLRAAEAHLESLRYWTALDDRYGWGEAHAHLALVADAAGRDDLAAPLRGFAEKSLAGIGGVLPPATARRLDTVPLNVADANEVGQIAAPGPREIISPDAIVANLLSALAS